jgi:vacuolar iron transporter family protein
MSRLLRPSHHAAEARRHDNHRHFEVHKGDRAAWLRAAVLGANDGLLSTASLMLGVGAASPTRTAVLTAGFAATVAGSLSMAVGEYSSVSSQRDTELADIARERVELEETPEAEQAELAAIYRKRGLSHALAGEVAAELSAGDALAHHLRDELGLDPNGLSRPVQAAVVSASSFAAGSAVPVLVALAVSNSGRSPAIVVVTLAALMVLGAVGARLGGAPMLRPALRVLVGGAIALAVATLLGRAIGTAV